MELLEQAFQMKGIDGWGLTKTDRDYLGRLIESDEPTGAETLATALGESVETLTDSIEPYLLQQGYISRTPRGRMATARARQLFQEVTA
jgi:holliday junction DNA helicase RuvB